jgi:hypothetical protein
MNDFTSLSQQATYIDAQGGKPRRGDFKPVQSDRLKLNDQPELGFSLLLAKVLEMRVALHLAIQHVNGDISEDEELEAIDLPHYRGELGFSIDPEPVTLGHDSVTKAA